MVATVCLVAHAGNTVYTIYPVTQSQETVSGAADFTTTVDVVAESGIDAATMTRATDVLTQFGLKANVVATPTGNNAVLYLGINGSKLAADASATTLSLKRDVFTKDGKFDRHCVSLTSNNGKARVIILGENTNATFYGLATLEQILEKGTKNLPCVNIYDYADVQSRGIVEGYYGYPYSVSVKKDLMKFMMRNKMNTYLYGAKSDPYHSGYWQNAYPTTITATQEKNGWLTQNMLKDLATESKATKVNFIWAIHPGSNFTGSSTVVTDIMNKYNMMYQLGIRQFAVFVDDVGVPTGNEALNADRLIALQDAIDKKYNIAGAAPEDTVRPLHFVPQIYAASFAGAAARKTFFNELGRSDKKITIYTTGNGIWSIPNSNDLQTIKTDLGRDLGWWWNYPCNDNADSRIYPMDMYSNFNDMPAVGSGSLSSSISNCVSIISNPMQEGEVAKIPLFSVADYAWNTAGFNNASSWNASFYAITDSTNAKVLKALAPYLRQNETSTLSSLISTFKASLTTTPNPTALKKQMDEIIANCQAVKAWETGTNESDKLLANDIKPWTDKLLYMAQNVNNYIDAVSQTDKSEKWKSYLISSTMTDSLSTKDDFQVYTLEGMGVNPPVANRPSTPSNKYLLPFLSYMQDNAAKGLFTKTTQTKPELISNAENNPRGAGVYLNGVEYFLTSVAPVLKKGQYAGISLVNTMVPAGINIADSVYEHYTVLYSVNAKKWFPLTKGEIPTTAFKYICFLNESDETRTFSLTGNVFKVTEPTIISTITAAQIPSGTIEGSNSADKMYDGSYTTYCVLNKNQAQGDSYIYTLKSATPVYDVRMCIGTTNGDYMNVANVMISADNTTWKSIPIQGTTTTDFTMSDSHVVKYSDDMSYCDFYANGATAKYIKFYLKNANTSKWMRIYEVEVNKRPYANLSPIAYDQSSTPITTLNDAVANTNYTATKTTGSITYNFIKPYQLSDVTFYSDGATLSAAAKVEITTNGTDWTQIGSLNDYTNTFDLSSTPNATAIRVSWTAGKPAIYEIVEGLSENKVVVTGIQAVSNTTVENLKLTANTQGGLTISSPVSLKSATIYDLSGRMILKQAIEGSQASLPIVGGKTLIVSIETMSGQKMTYKVTTK